MRTGGASAIIGKLWRQAIPHHWPDVVDELDPGRLESVCSLAMSSTLRGASWLCCRVVLPATLHGVVFLKLNFFIKILERSRPKQNVSVRRKTRKTLFYRDIPGTEELVFAPPEVAEYVSAIQNAMEAKTWGEFKARMPPKEYERLVKKVQDGETDQDKLPSDDNSPFDPGDWFPEWFDGDYPDWLQQRQAEWLPKSIINRYAEQVDSVHNGFFWSIKSGSETSILRDLRRAGFRVKRRNDLEFG